MSYFVQTGQWNGHFYQYGNEYPMTFTNFYISPVPQGNITGSGSDSIGNFEIRGSFNNNATAVRFAKHYIERHTIYYEGKFNGKCIEGFWAHSINGFQEDSKFKIWMNEEA